MFLIIIHQLFVGMELVGPSWREFTMTIASFFWASGYIVLAVVAYGLRGWRDLALALAVPQVIMLIAMLYV